MCRYAAALLADPCDHDVTEKRTPIAIEAASTINEAPSGGFAVIR